MKHILFTLKGCPYHLLDDEAHIRNVLVNAASYGMCTLLTVTSHKFDPCDVTAIALLAESHISIHTWPEKNMAVCDVFTCGANNLPNASAEYMYERMEASEWIGTEIDRKLNDE